MKGCGRLAGSEMVLFGSYGPRNAFAHPVQWQRAKKIRVAGDDAVKRTTAWLWPPTLDDVGSPLSTAAQTQTLPKRLLTVQWGIDAIHIRTTLDSRPKMASCSRRTLMEACGARSLSPAPRRSMTLPL